ncbi:MAG: hypothetical protein IT529_03195 [Burkholderiales bacterium]|nr:hypothetical protein [Burkholderiales bacterium]
MTPAGVALPAPRRLWWWYAIAAATFLPAVGFHYVGEEAIFPISSLEMWHRGEWVRQVLYGANLKHNPLFNWLIIPFAAAAGWEHVLAVTRALTIAATIGTGLVLAWLALELHADRAFAAFAALVYLTLADVFFYRGWLAYADPAFAFFLFFSAAALWVACRRESIALLALAAALLACAFLTKALTAYVYYGTVAGLLFLLDARYRRFLLGAGSWLIHLAAAALPLAWLYALPENAGQGERMFGEILAKLVPHSAAAYAAKLALYAFDAALRLMPALAVALWYRWRAGGNGPIERDGAARLATWMALATFAPYWLAPQSSMRYLMPVYPLAALAIARVLWSAGPRAVRAAAFWIAAAIAVKLVVVLAAFPYYQQHYRGAAYADAARRILERTGGQPLYTSDVTASGLSVTAHLDTLRLPRAPLTFPPQEWQSGFILHNAEDPVLGRTVERYRFGGNVVYLLCRGAACGR